MIQPIFRNCIPTLLSFSLLLAISHSPIAEGQESEDFAIGCDQAEPPQITDATTVRGRGELRLNEEGTLLLALDTTGNSQTDVLFRVATNRNEPGLQAVLESSRPCQSFMVLQRDGVDYHDLEISGFDGDVEAALFVMDRRDCAADEMPTEIIASTARIQAIAISRETSPDWKKSPSQLVSDRMHDPMIVRQSEIEADSDAQTQFEPLWCMAGGEGAVSCSLSFGGIGPINSGECSIECGNFPATYACCGPAFAGRNCQCIAPTQQLREGLATVTLAGAEIPAGAEAPEAGKMMTMAPATMNLNASDADSPTVHR